MPRARGGPEPPAPPPPREPIDYETQNADRCDVIDQAACLFPFPNDHFTVADPTTDTGRRLNLKGAVDAEEPRRQGDHAGARTTATTASARAR